MKIVDFHCDVLSKLLEDDKLAFHNGKPGALDVTYERLQAADAVLQTFAIYIPRAMSGRLEPMLESIDRFHEKVLACGNMKWVKTAADLEQCLSEGKIGALLSLEGVDGLQGNMSMLRTMHRLGVRAAGMTWNNANWAADGVMEPRGGGLTGLGRLFVEESDKLGIILDVSHLSERAFWEMAELTALRFIASHSNAKAICNHPRNLNDDQLLCIIQNNGMIGITFVPYFVAHTEKVSVDDVVRHIEHVCELGGEQSIMLGSDFDGIDVYVDGLTHPGELYRLKEALLKTYTDRQVERFLCGNAIDFLLKRLP